MAEKFATVSGVAAPLLLGNIDTDTIAPGSRPLNRAKKQEFSEKGSASLAQDLFGNWRYDKDGEEIPEFVLNRPEFRNAKILLTGQNFGCGSSRETAVWMLKEWGIRCIVAPSFGEIFYGNCFKNALLPVVLPESEIRAMADETNLGPCEINLAEKLIRTPANRVLRLEVPEFLRRGLLDGLDEIDLTLQREVEIAAFFSRAAKAWPWMYRLPPTGASIANANISPSEGSIT